MSINDTAKETADLLKNLEHVSGFLANLKQQALDLVIAKFELKENLISSHWTIYRDAQEGCMTATFAVRYSINGKENTHKETVELHKLDTRDGVMKTVQEVFEKLVAKIIKEGFSGDIARALQDAVLNGIVGRR